MAVIGLLPLGIYVNIFRKNKYEWEERYEKNT